MADFHVRDTEALKVTDFFHTFDGRLPIMLNTIGETSKQGAIYRDKYIKCNQFIWLRGGEGDFYSGEKHFKLTKGQGVFLRNGESHGYGGENLHTAWVTFYSSENLLDYVMGDKKYIIFDVPDFLDREAEELRLLAMSGTGTLELSAAAYTFVTELFAAITKNEDSVISITKKFMKENYQRAITLDEIAASAGLDRFALCRYYKKHHKRSVIHELRKIRISVAKRLLRYSSEKIEDIAKMCGFEDASYFALCFRREALCSPLEYRNKYS